MKKIILTANAPLPIGPYSQAVLAGNTLYISGQIAINPQSGNLVTQTIEVETTQVLQNLQAVLQAADMECENVVKTTIFLTNMDDFAKVNQVYGTFFSSNYAARETVAVKTLPKNVNVEISAIAIK
ncbi:MAG: RidA family protein [Sphingobacteriales bacterium]|nr:MAG: RidA family protein [Sphingobacteriales bacterium]